MKKMARQGDVFLVRIEDKTVEEDINTAKEVPPEKGSVILAHGEATGHAHRVDATVAKLYTVDDERYLRVSQHTQLLHEEHGPIVLEKGTYKVIRQREYAPREVRYVRD